MKKSENKLECSYYCYVCNKKIKNNPIYIGNGMYRHIRCHAGSKKWLHSKITKHSKLIKELKSIYKKLITKNYIFI